VPKILLSFFWDMKGLILEHYQEKGQTVNRASYSAVIHKKRRGLLSKTVLLHQEKDCPHVPSAEFKTSSLRFYHIHLTDLTSHHATFMPLVHLQKHYMVTGLAVMKKRRNNAFVD
jgi:Transposase.